MKIQADARAAGLPCYLVVDAGRTEIPEGSITVCAVGPARASQLNPITGSFPLL